MDVFFGAKYSNIVVALFFIFFANCRFFYLPTGDTTKSPEDGEVEEREEVEEDEQ